MKTETKKKISKTKRTKESQKLKQQSQNCDLEQAIPQFKVSGNRKKNHISFDDYKRLVAQSKTRQDMIQITSKHLINFYNNLIKGKYEHVAKEEFEELYNQGKELNEIAKHFNIPRGDTTFMREFLGIKRKGATFQKRIKNEVPLTEDQKSVIIGSILGDGGITREGYYQEKHSLKQEEYLRWKAKMLSSIIAPENVTTGVINDKRRNTSYEYIGIRSKVHSWLKEMRALFYDADGVKIIPDNIEELLNPLVVTVWYLDDGVTDWRYTASVKSGQNKIPSCTFCTDCFDIEGQNKLIETLSNTLNIDAALYSGKTRSRIKIYKKDSVNRLLDVISSNTPTEDMTYKSDRKVYCGTRQKMGEYRNQLL